MSGELLDSTDEAFLELLCADDDLVRSEFEAIVAANWVGPPHRPTPVPSPRPPAPAMPEGSWLPPREVPVTEPVPSGPGDGQRGRERSPPCPRAAVGRPRDGDVGSGVGSLA
jgi:hypothetical protein